MQINTKQIAALRGRTSLNIWLPSLLFLNQRQASYSTALNASKGICLPLVAGSRTASSSHTGLSWHKNMKTCLYWSGISFELCFFFVVVVVCIFFCWFFKMKIKPLARWNEPVSVRRPVSELSWKRHHIIQWCPVLPFLIGTIVIMSMIFIFI